jgi:hypothetical protein
MRDADIVFGMMVDGVATVLDSYSTGDFGPHSADVNQGGADDLLSSGGVRTASMTTFEFERSLRHRRCCECRCSAVCGLRN